MESYMQDLYRARLKSTNSASAKMALITLIQGADSNHLELSLFRNCSFVSLLYMLADFVFLE